MTKPGKGILAMDESNATCGSRLEGVGVEAAAPQLRVMAEETRELIVEKLFKAVPQPPASAEVDQPPRLRRPSQLGPPPRLQPASAGAGNHGCARPPL